MIQSYLVLPQPAQGFFGLLGGLWFSDAMDFGGLFEFLTIIVSVAWIDCFGAVSS